jgi:prepilin-type N-terminal cleavage/methylation domain-containing protein
MTFSPFQPTLRFAARHGCCADHPREARSVGGCKRPAKGFTLIEVLVSAAILSILMAVMFAALSTSLSLWRNTDSKMIADREARAAHLMLALDLANAVLPADTKFWPRLRTNGSNIFLQLLTTAPADFQPSVGGTNGDVCYVEYSIPAGTDKLMRFFYGSEQTFTDILQGPGFRSAPTTNDAQLLAANILTNNRDAVRDLSVLFTNADRRNFNLLNPSLALLTNAYSNTNWPAVVEVNFSVGDPNVTANQDLLKSASYRLRNAGAYSLRFQLPKPPNAQ